MGRPVNLVRPESMNLVLCCVLVYVSVVVIAPSSAEPLDVYPEYPDADLIRRLARVLSLSSEWRQYQLPRDPPEPESAPVGIPEFTYRFPEETNRNYQNGYFAVPPSDPRFYEPVPELPANPRETKRLEGEPKPLNQQVEAKSPTEEPVPAEDVGSQSVEDEDIATPSPDEPTTESAEDVAYVFKKLLAKDDDIVVVAIIAGCGAAAAAGVVALSIGWYKLHTNSKAAADIEYPAYGVTGPNKEITPTGDRRLAQSAQMYHYQHQKQQIIAMESNRANNERRGSVSEGDSEEENEEGDYTVYECPGLAATGELEVKNPLFLDDPTPAAGNHVNEEPRSPPTDKK